jgi:ribosomal protein S21
LFEVTRKDNERKDRLFRRFNRSVQMSGILREIKKKRFREDEPNRRERRESAIRSRKIKELKRKKFEGY